MTHFLFFYLLFSFVIGGVSLFFSLVLQLTQTGHPVELKRNLFTISLTVIIVLQIVVEYLQNTGLQAGWFFPILLAASDIAVFFLVFVLPRYVHELRTVPFKNVMNAILAGIFIVLTLLRVIPLPSHIDSFIINIGGMFFYSSIIYSCLIVLMYKDEDSTYGTSSVQTLSSAGTIIFIFLMFFFNLFVDTSLYVGTFISVNSIFFSSYYLIYSIVNIFLGIGTIKSLKISPENGTVLTDLRRLYGVTDRETEIIHHLVSGMSYREIGESLFISVDTVKTHTQNIYKKMSVNNKISLVRRINELNAKGFTDA